MKLLTKIFDEIRGSIKTATFKTYGDKRKIVYLHKKPIPSYTRTTAQDQQRTKFEQAVEEWHSLTDEEKQQYEEQASPYGLTGYQYFIKQKLLEVAPSGVWYKVTIDNTDGAELTDYQILIQITADDQFFTDCENKREAIRLYDEDKSTALSYWIEEFDITNHNAKIWVKVPSIPAAAAKYIYISVDPSRTEDASNGDNTFLFFDDFNGSSIDTTKWNVYDNKDTDWIISVSGSILSITYDGHPANKYYSLLSKNTFSPPTKVIFKNKGSCFGKVLYTRTGFMEDHAFGDNLNNYIVICDPTDEAGADKGYLYTQIKYDGTEAKQDNGVEDGSNWHTYEIRWKTGEVIFKKDGSTLTPPSISIPSLSMYAAVEVFNHSSITNTNSRTWQWDWIAVAKYASPEPAISYKKETTKKK